MKVHSIEHLEVCPIKMDTIEMQKIKLKFLEPYFTFHHV